MSDDTLRELEHTADIGFEVIAGSLERLFRLAADGLVRALGATASTTRRPSESDADATNGDERLELERPDLERLLVAWLRELLHRATTERRLPRVTELRVRPEVEGAAELEARVTWLPVDQEPVREIKGVTYHGLRVERAADGWHARVVLDV